MARLGGSRGVGKVWVGQGSDEVKEQEEGEEDDD